MTHEQKTSARSPLTISAEGLQMHAAKIKSVQCFSPAGLHQMAYKEWGDENNPRVLICVHGLARVSDDFDALAQTFAEHYRVICPDVVGRGRSGRLRNPAFYQLIQYVSDMVTLIARLTANGACQQVDWLGTSMGGLIGLLLAAQEGAPVRKLLLNDVGPTLDATALHRISQYIGQDIVFPNYAVGALYIREVSASFGPHSKEEWDKLARDVLREQPDGQWKRHYDIALAAPFKLVTDEAAKEGEKMLWAAYDAITCPTLLVRGQNSDLLSATTAKAMTERGPKAQLIELAGIGHAPTFVHADQIALAKNFFMGEG